MDFVSLHPDENSHNGSHSPPGKILAKLDGAEFHFTAGAYAEMMICMFIRVSWWYNILLLEKHSHNTWHLYVSRHLQFYTLESVKAGKSLQTSCDFQPPGQLGTVSAGINCTAACNRGCKDFLVL